MARGKKQQKEEKTVVVTSPLEEITEPEVGSTSCLTCADGRQIEITKQLNASKKGGCLAAVIDKDLDHQIMVGFGIGNGALKSYATSADAFVVLMEELKRERYSY